MTYLHFKPLAISQWQTTIYQSVNFIFHNTRQLQAGYSQSVNLTVLKHRQPRRIVTHGFRAAPQRLPHSCILILLTDAHFQNTQSR